MQRIRRSVIRDIRIYSLISIELVPSEARNDQTIRNYPTFRPAMPDYGVRTYVLLPRSPVALAGPLDLHALSTPPAFTLS